MGKKTKSKPEENLGEVTKAEVINAAESIIYNQDKENKNENLEKNDIGEQDYKMEKTKSSAVNALIQKDTEKSNFFTKSNFI